ncbi:hypothetical protein OG558_43065 [Kribbella sp. NBC_01510]
MTAAKGDPKFGFADWLAGSPAVSPCSDFLARGATVLDVRRFLGRGEGGG